VFSWLVIDVVDDQKIVLSFKQTISSPFHTFAVDISNSQERRCYAMCKLSYRNHGTTEASIVYPDNTLHVLDK